MRFGVRCFLAAAALALLTHSASTAEVNLRKYSAAELKAACETVGGSFSQDSSGYGCGTDCNGASGTDCAVFCPANAKRCTAQVTGSRRPKTIEQALAPRSKQKN